MIFESVRILAGTDSTSLQRIEKPWGCELLWAQSRNYAAKILRIEPRHRLSLQCHRVKDETLLLLRGYLMLELESSTGRIECHRVLPGHVFHISPGRRHRLTAMTLCEVLEVSSPELDDVLRFHDDYGRC